MAKSILYSAILEAISGKDHDDLYEVIIEAFSTQEKFKFADKNYTFGTGAAARNRDDWKTDECLWKDLRLAEKEKREAHQRMLERFAKKIEIELEAERIKTKKRVLLAGVMFIGAVIGAATVFFFSEKPRDLEMFRVMD